MFNLKIVKELGLMKIKSKKVSPIQNWQGSTWGDLKLSQKSNVLIFDQGAKDTACGATAVEKFYLGKNQKYLILKVSNSKKSQFLEHRLIKINHTTKDKTLKILTLRDFAADPEYVLPRDGVFVYEIPQADLKKDKDGSYLEKIGFVFWKAQLNKLKVEIFFG
jgi:hypothetical protein